MPELTLQLDEAVAQTIRDTAKRRKITEQQCAAQILAAHHEEHRHFPDGVLREGREKLIALLSQIPCLSEFKSSGVDFRYWWVSFDLDTASPIAWPVIRRLGFLLNTQSAEMMLPTVFKPAPSEQASVPIRWEIASTAPRLDPADVENWLRAELPQPLSDEDVWIDCYQIADSRLPDALRQRRVIKYFKELIRMFPYAKQRRTPQTPRLECWSIQDKCAALFHKHCSSLINHGHTDLMP